MKFHFHRSLLALSAAVAALFIMPGCRENTLVNSKVSPAANAVGVWDTVLSCNTGSYYDDTLVTSGNALVAAGFMTDPYFGTMRSEPYFQVVPTNPVTGLFDAIDSAFLVLPYSGFTYGDTADQGQTQNYHVWLLGDTLATTSPYKTWDSKLTDVELTPGAVSVNTYRLRDSLRVNGVNYRPGARIRLDAAKVLQKLKPVMDGISASGAPVDYFRGAFRGICVKADSTSSRTAIPYFALIGGGLYNQAGMVVYYHAAARPDSALIENYYFNSTNCAVFSNITKRNAGYPAASRNADNDTAIALQNLPGMTMNVRIPGISKLPRGIINMAVLEIPVLPYGNTTLQRPSSIYPVGVGNGTYPVGTASGIGYNVADRYPLASASPFAIIDGGLHTISRNGQSVLAYTIGIPREVMSSLAAKNDVLHLHVIGSSDFMGAYHLVAGGGNNTNPLYQTRLKVVYSSLNK